MSLSTEWAQVALVGAGATAVMDLWLLALARIGLPVSSFALIGRWVGHMPRGRFFHAGIARSAVVPHELALGWVTHYVIGVAYAAVLVALVGADWLHAPMLLPALGFGIVTVAAPMFIMQPAMGAGIAASKTPAPWKNSLRSVANHAVFGLGLYLAALAASAL